MFEVFLSDNVKARILMPDGIYKKHVISKEDKHIDSQEYFFDEAYEQAKKWRNKIITHN